VSAAAAKVFVFLSKNFLPRITPSLRRRRISADYNNNNNNNIKKPAAYHGSFIPARINFNTLKVSD
jgi:hypothetical protein